MIISHDLLERTCKNMIETILLCLENATRGTVYRIGRMPRLRAMRVTSGERENGNGKIKWGLPEASDYNTPGKSWEQYRDRPGHVLEAMGWCVEKQKSWTADDPYEDIRSVRKQLRGEIEDFHHMEPVLVRKTDVGEQLFHGVEYPRDWQGNRIWQDNDYIVVAVIKIHFLPYTIHRGDRSTKIIKKLSRTLGTELLSLALRETLSNAQKELTHQRLHTCNALAHDMRNTLAKLSFIFSAVNAEISFLREQWEMQLRQVCPVLDDKQSILARLNQLVIQGLQQLNGAEDLVRIGQELLSQQEKFANLSPLPQQGETWIRNRIRQRWMRLLMTSRVWEDAREEIQQLLDRLEQLLWVGLDAELAKKIDSLPEDLKDTWVKIAYTNFSAERLDLLQEILRFLEHPALRIPHKQQTKKILISLKALVDIIPEMEERANRMIFALRDGSAMDGPQLPVP
jgi:branched-subunit amino acid transport protein AzlD